MSTLPKENLVRRREQVLADVLATSLYVDVLHFDNGVPLFFQRYEEEGDDIDGQMIVIPPPSVELEASTTIKGLVHVNVLPRTLPISSTHGGRESRRRGARLGRWRARWGAPCCVVLER